MAIASRRHDVLKGEDETIISAHRILFKFFSLSMRIQASVNCEWKPSSDHIHASTALIEHFLKRDRGTGMGKNGRVPCGVPESLCWDSSKEQQEKAST